MPTLTANHQIKAPRDASHQAILCQYLPKQVLKQYHLTKIALSIMIGSIFVWWIVVHRGNIAMQGATGILLLATAYITYLSIKSETTRDQDRQISATQDTLIIQTGRKTTTIHKQKISHAIWREDTYQTQGLHLIGKQGQPLGHIDGQVLSNQEDARSFLRWIRSQANTNFDVQWDNES